MQKFAKLFWDLDQTSSTLEKVALLKNYFANVDFDDAAWALFFLSGKRLKRFLSPSFLKQWCLEETSLPEWLFKECYASTGDTAETVTLLMQQKSSKTKPSELTLSTWMKERILPLKGLTEEQQREQVLAWWKELSYQEAFILNKLLTGSFRIGVSALLTIRALSSLYPVSKTFLSHQLMGEWEPSAAFFETLTTESASAAMGASPYPFCLAHSYQDRLEKLGAPNEWLVEYKWDGIRSQLVLRQEQCALWSRNAELISHQFPEIVDAAQTTHLNFVIDGEVLGYRDALPLSFGHLQRRLGRKKPSSQMIQDFPVVLMAYDLLEIDGHDLRACPLQQRRGELKRLIQTLNSPLFLLSSPINFQTWEELEQTRQLAREKNTEGLMLKHFDSVYTAGRQRGLWWKYKIDPFTLDLVLIYAQPGTGRRANLYTDYTFGAWVNNELVPVTKAYSGLSQEEITELDRWIRKHTIEKFGPVRRLEPYYVFEIAFEGIQPSNRHKSGVALRFPRILRWRKDKPLQEADTLENVKSLIQSS